MTIGVVLVSLAFGIYVVLSVGFYAFMPAFIAGGQSAIALSAGAIALMVPLGNLLTGALVRGRDARFAAWLATIGFAATAAAALPAFAGTSVLPATLAAVVLAVSGGVTASALFASVPLILPKGGSAAVAIGLICQAGGIGTVFGPPLAGQVIESYGWPGFGWFLAGSAAVGIVSLSPLLASRSSTEFVTRETETEVVIRPAQERDIEVLARLRCDAFFESTDRTQEEDAEGLRQLLLDARFEIALAAELEGVVVGSCLFVRQELEPAHDVAPWLAGLVVAPGHRRRGIGQKLVRAIEDHARSLGTPELYLYSWDARTFYLKLNWQAVEAFQQDGEPMMLMRKRLSGYGLLETPAT